MGTWSTTPATATPSAPSSTATPTSSSQVLATPTHPDTHTPPLHSPTHPVPSLLLRSLTALPPPSLSLPVCSNQSWSSASRRQCTWRQPARAGLTMWRSAHLPPSSSAAAARGRTSTPTRTPPRTPSKPRPYLHHLLPSVTHTLPWLRGSRHSTSLECDSNTSSPPLWPRASVSSHQADMATVVQSSQYLLHSPHLCMASPVSFCAPSRADSPPPCLVWQAGRRAGGAHGRRLHPGRHHRRRGEREEARHTDRAWHVRNAVSNFHHSLSGSTTSPLLGPGRCVVPIDRSRKAERAKSCSSHSRTAVLPVILVSFGSSWCGACATACGCPPCPTTRRPRVASGARTEPAVGPGPTVMADRAGRPRSR